MWYYVDAQWVVAISASLDCMIRGYLHTYPSWNASKRHKCDRFANARLERDSMDTVRLSNLRIFTRWHSYRMRSAAFWENVRCCGRWQRLPGYHARTVSSSREVRRTERKYASCYARLWALRRSSVFSFSFSRRRSPAARVYRNDESCDVRYASRFWHFLLGCTISPLISRNPLVDRSISFAFAWGTPINQSCHEWNFTLFTLHLWSLTRYVYERNWNIRVNCHAIAITFKGLAFAKKKEEEKNNIEWIYVMRNVNVIRNDMLHNVNINN